jgi:uncharacterized protein YjdB
MGSRIGLSAAIALLGLGLVLGLSACGGSHTSASTSSVISNPALTGVTVSSPSSSVTLGSTLSLKATATYSDGSSKDVTAQAAWTSSNTTDATVSASGLVSTLAVASSVTISAAFGGKSGEMSLSITTAGGPTLNGVAVTSPSSSVAVGSALALTATASYSDGTSTDVTSQATWTSSNKADATVSNTGVVTPLAVASSVTITGSFGGQSGQTAIAITAGGGPTLTGVAVTSPSTSVTVGSTLSLTASASYSDETSKDVTSEATWTSSIPTDASVSDSGVVSAVAVAASVTITAGFGGESGATVLAVTTGGGSNAIPASLFGMSAHDGVLFGEPWPTMAIFGMRLWDSHIGWGQINTAKGIYDWSTLDSWIAAAASHKTELIYTFGYTPSWASSKSNDDSCDNGPGACDPPSDLNTDGTGSDQHFIDFVSAIAQHAPSITYWEMWNTPHDIKQWTGTDAQLVRMTQDARTYLKKYIPGAKIISPANGQLQYTAPSANCTMPDKMGGYFAAGLGKYIDIVGLHTYYTIVPEDIVSVIKCYQSTMATYNLSSLPLWSTEGAWGTNAELSSATKQAGFVARLYLLLWSNGVARHYGYSWDDAYTGSLSVKGVTNTAGTAYAQVESWMTGRTMSTLCSESTSSGIWTCGFTGINGYESQAVWHPAGNKSYTPPSQYINYLDLGGKKHTISKGATVTVGVEPILLQNQ